MHHELSNSPGVKVGQKFVASYLRYADNIAFMIESYEYIQSIIDLFRNWLDQLISQSIDPFRIINK